MSARTRSRAEKPASASAPGAPGLEPVRTPVPSRPQLRLASLDAHAAVRHAVDICRREIAAGHVEMRTELVADRPIVDADWARLVQVLCILARNAVVFATPGRRVRLRSGNDASGGWFVDLVGHGDGLESALWTRAFSQLQRHAAPAQQLHAELGRRLNLARRLGEAQGGQLSAAGHGFGRGAALRFTLPAGRPPNPFPAGPFPRPNHRCDPRAPNLPAVRPKPL